MMLNSSSCFGRLMGLWNNLKLCLSLSRKQA
jgi:hypothetical protein